MVSEFKDGLRELFIALYLSFLENDDLTAREQVFDTVIETLFEELVRPIEDADLRNEMLYHIREKVSEQFGIFGR
jgi:hypothetical protein